MGSTHDKGHESSLFIKEAHVEKSEAHNDEALRECVFERELLHHGSDGLHPMPRTGAHRAAGIQRCMESPQCPLVGGTSLFAVHDVPWRIRGCHIRIGGYHIRVSMFRFTWNDMKMRHATVVVAWGW